MTGSAAAPVARRNGGGKGSSSEWPLAGHVLLGRTAGILECTLIVCAKEYGWEGTCADHAEIRAIEQVSILEMRYLLMRAPLCGRWLRVIIEQDGETIHNVFWDRNFKP
jgi:hypothetical protein